MPYEVQEPTIDLHAENKFHYGYIKDVFEEEGNYGKQLKWVIVLDDDGTYTDDEGQEVERETWTWCSTKLTTHENNKFRKFVKGLTGKEPEKGELIDEKQFINQRVGVMFEHGKKSDGSPTERVTILAAEEHLK